MGTQCSYTANTLRIYIFQGYQLYTNFYQVEYSVAMIGKVTLEIESATRLENLGKTQDLLL